MEIGEPPSAAGAVQVTVAEALPAVALAAVGATGTVAGASGVTLFEAAEAVLSPTALLAMMVKETGVPLVRPLKMALVFGKATVSGAVAGLEVMV